MQANVGDMLLMSTNAVGQRAQTVEVIEVLGENGGPPYRVRAENGMESVVSPGPDTEIISSASEG
ncbi:DUF1918 domain-containing protein [Streptomyces griseoincarnatus]